jgi:DNA-binding NtrC family response regulator
MMRSEHSILIVEDEPTLRTAVARHLRRAYAEVLEAQSCAQAIGLLQTETFDAIVVDVHLDDGDGFQILDTLASPGPAIVLITADRNIDNAICAMNRQVSGFLLKPFELETLDAVLSGALAGRGQRHACATRAFGAAQSLA